MQFSYPCDPGEYCLGKNLGVALWLDYREFLKEPQLTDVHDFIVINSHIHDQFDLFKKATVNDSYSFVPVCELFIFYCASQCPNLPASKVEKYGSKD